MGERVEKEEELVKERCQVSKSSCTRVAGFGGALRVLRPLLGVPRDA